jgi:hypothetical protein
VEYLDDVSDPADALLAEQVTRRFRLYRDALSGQVPDTVDADDPDDEADLPDDPTVLSYLSPRRPAAHGRALACSLHHDRRPAHRPHPARARQR